MSDSGRFADTGLPGRRLIDFRSLKFQVTLLTTCVLIVILASVALVSTMMAERDLRASLSAQQGTVTRQVAQDVALKVAMARDMLVEMAGRIPKNELGNPVAMEKNIQSNGALFASFFTDIAILNSKGVVYADWPQLAGRRGTNYEYRDYFKQPMANGLPYISPPFMAKLHKTPIIVISVPVLDAQGRPVNVISGLIHLQKPNFLGGLANRRIGKNGYYLLADKDNTVLSHFRPERIMQKIEGDGVFAAIEPARTGESVQVQGFSRLNESRLYMAEPVSGTDWMLISAIPTEEALQPIVALRTRMLVLSGLIVLALIPCLWWFVSWTLRPLSVLMAAVARRGGTAGGALDIDAEKLRGAEIKVLANQFNELIERLAFQVQVSQENEERLIKAQQSAQIGNWELDLVSGKLFWSDEIYRIFEIDRVQFDPSYEAFLNAIHPEDRDKVNLAYQVSLENKTPYQIDHRLMMPDGRIKHVQERCDSTFDEAGKPVRSRGTVQDITERVQIEEKVRVALQEKEVLLKEVYHRVKNNLQVISSLLIMQSAGAGQEARSLLVESANRVKSMGLVHEQLYQSTDLSHIDFARYIQRLLENLSQIQGSVTQRVAVRADVDPIELSIEAAIPLGLMINELVSNSYKHAYPGDRSGQISLRLKRLNEGALELIVMDDGVGLPAGFDPARLSSLGMRLVVSLAEQLEGHLTCGMGEQGQGARFTVRFVPEEETHTRLGAAAKRN